MAMVAAPYVRRRRRGELNPTLQGKRRVGIKRLSVLPHYEAQGLDLVGGDGLQRRIPMVNSAAARVHGLGHKAARVEGV